PKQPSTAQTIASRAGARSQSGRRRPCAAIDQGSRAGSVIACLALNPLLLTVDRGFHAGGGFRILPRDLAERGTGGFLLLQRGQRLPEPQERIGRFSRFVILRRHAEKGFGRIAILLALKIAFAEPVLGV